MKPKNIVAQYKKNIEKIHAQIAKELIIGAMQLGQKLRDEIAERTPVDMGDLRAKWAVMPVEKQGNRYIIRVTNPAEYAAYVEFGYMQRPGMILKMIEEKGKLRFVKFLGYSAKYGIGDPTGKVEPDKDGYYTIITRKRFIKGQFMAREGLKVTKEKHWPKLEKYLLKRIKNAWESVK